MGAAQPGEIAEIPLYLTNDIPVHGFILVFEWDGERGIGEDLVPRDQEGEILSTADTVVGIVNDDHMIFGVSMDSDSADCEMIPVGERHELGTAHIRCTPSNAAVDEVTAIRFVDDKYSARPDLPTLDNLLLILSRFFTSEVGLILNDGSFSCSDDDGGTAFACGW